MYSLFPFQYIEKGSDIVLYGAGIAGRNFLLQIQALQWCNVVCMVDQNYQSKRIRNMQVIPPEKISDYQFDKIVITQINSKIQDEIKETLMSKGIPQDKIVSFVSKPIDWNHPNTYFANQNEEYLWSLKVGDYLEKINPHLLVTSKRIDIVVRYLLFRDFVEKIENQTHLSLFSRFTLCRTGGVESASFYSGDGKQSVEEYVAEGKKLCESIAKDGFEAEHFIPLGQNGRAYDGLHRIAAAIAANEEVWVKHYNDRAALDVDMGWFQKEGFLFEDQLRVMRGFTDIYAGKCGIYVFYAPSENLWNYMEGQIADRFCVVGKLDYDYTNNWYAFNNVQRLIYNDYDRFSEWLSRKMDILAMAPLKYRIVLVSDEGHSYDDFYLEMRNLKLDLRQRLFEDIDDRIPVTIHGTDSYDEFIHLKQIFLSANNYYWNDKRLKQYYNPEFLSKLEEVKSWCRNNKVSYQDVCIVGSAVLELLGIRPCKNINIVVKSRYEVSDNLNCGNIEILTFNYCQNEKEETYNNDVIIEDDEYHFIFADLKFCNLQFVERYKKNRGLDKDKLDLNKIRNWNSFVNNFDNKKALQERITVEMRKRGLLDV